MLKGLVKFPFRVVRGAIRRFTGGRDVDGHSVARSETAAAGVRVPTRTEPPPVAQPAPVQPATAPSTPAASPAPQAAAGEPAQKAAPAEKAAAPEPAAKEAPAPKKRARSTKAAAPVAEEPAPAKAAKGKGTRAKSTGTRAKSTKGSAKGGKSAKKDDEGEPTAAPAAPPVRVEGEPTPNPNAMKFTCSVKVVPKGSLSYNNAEVAHGHPLGRALFALGGVKAVFAVNDFVTVTKDDEASWAMLVPQVEQVISDVLAERA